MSLPIKSKVYFLPWAKRNKLLNFLTNIKFANIFKQNDLVAIKTHFGEKGNKGFVKPEFFEPIIKLIQKKRAYGFLTDTNTIYVGERNQGVKHLIQAAKHGFSYEKLGVPIVIADGLKGSNYSKIKINAKHFQEVKIASSFIEANTIIAVSHFKGHILTGFGGAIKNLGMGCAARLGKFEMHSTVAPAVNTHKCTACELCLKVCPAEALKIVGEKINLDLQKCLGCGECVVACRFGALTITWNESSKNLQEKIAEYALGAVLNKNLFCLSFINHITMHCDCLKDSQIIGPNIGILASKDQVAIDQAGLDLVKKKAGEDIFKKAHPTIDHEAQLAHAEKIGLGTRKYELIEL
ncbi:MAG: DUF362 domain-containing protein [Pseudomonadota bacterium]